MWVWRKVTRNDVGQWDRMDVGSDKKICWWWATITDGVMGHVIDRVSDKLRNQMGWRVLEDRNNSCAAVM